MPELKTYERLLLLLRLKGNDMPPKQKKALIKQIIALEKSICKSIVKQFLTGTLILNITSLPPRVQKLAQRMLNRRLHIIYHLQNTHNQTLQLHKKHKEEISKLSFNLFKQSNNVGNLTPLQKLSSSQTENTTKHKKHSQILSNNYRSHE